MSKKVKIWEIEYSPDQEVRINRYFDLLDLDGASHNYKLLKEEFAKGEMTIDTFTESLFICEKDWRNMNRINRWVQFAKFPFQATLKDFDFKYPHKIDKRQILELDSMMFIKDGANVIFIGPTGIGKTHLSIALGRSAIQKGIDVRFFKLRDLAWLITKTKSQDQSSRLSSSLTKVDLLILDDIRAPMKPFSPLVCDFLYNVIIERHENSKPVILTTRTDFEGWERIFGNVDSSEGVIDRIGQRKIVVSIEGKSYRAADQMKVKKEVNDKVVSESSSSISATEVQLRH